MLSKYGRTFFIYSYTFYNPAAANTASHAALQLASIVFTAVDVFGAVFVQRFVKRLYGHSQHIETAVVCLIIMLLMSYVSKRSINASIKQIR